MSRHTTVASHRRSPLSCAGGERTSSRSPPAHGLVRAGRSTCRLPRDTTRCAATPGSVPERQHALKILAPQPPQPPGPSSNGSTFSGSKRRGTCRGNDPPPRSILAGPGAAARDPGGDPHVAPCAVLRSNRPTPHPTGPTETADPPRRDPPPQHPRPRHRRQEPHHPLQPLSHPPRSRQPGPWSSSRIQPLPPNHRPVLQGAGPSPAACQEVDRLAIRTQPPAPSPPEGQGPPPSGRRPLAPRTGKAAKTKEPKKRAAPRRAPGRRGTKRGGKASWALGEDRKPPVPPLAKSRSCHLRRSFFCGGGDV